MKHAPVLHPFFFALYPVTSVLAASLTLINPIQAIRPTVIMLLVCVFFLLVFYMFYKDWRRAGFMASMVIIMLFYYGYSYRLPREIQLFNVPVSRHILIILFWIIFISILASNWLWKRIRPHIITNFLNVSSGIAFVYAVYLLISVWLTINKDPLAHWTRPPYLPRDSIQLNSFDRPDIYYIILDGYARQDVLREIYGYDNGEFINGLKSRGFYVAEKAHSNYDYTQLSLASSLNFEYLDYLAFAEGVSSSWAPLGELILNNRASSLLEAIGYRTYLSSEYLFAEIKDPSVVFFASPKNRLNTFESLVLESTMFEILIDAHIVSISNYTYETHREKILNGFAETKYLVEQAGPKFVFVHIIAPHAPFVFDQTGNAVQPDGAYTIFDGSKFAGGLTAYKVGYRDQLIYINKLVLETIDYILQNSPSLPIIILQADHGPAALLGETIETSCLSERFSILNAFYFPNAKMHSLYSSITPVNTFRAIFDAYFGTKLGLLTDLSYFSSHEDPYRFKDVTPQVDTPCNPQ